MVMFMMLTDHLILLVRPHRIDPALLQLQRGVGHAVGGRYRRPHHSAPSHGGCHAHPADRWHPNPLGLRSGPLCGCLGLRKHLHPRVHGGGHADGGGGGGGGGRLLVWFFL